MLLSSKLCLMRLLSELLVTVVLPNLAALAVLSNECWEGSKPSQPSGLVGSFVAISIISVIKYALLMLARELNKNIRMQVNYRF